MDMNPTPTPVVSDYVTAYAKGRKAAQNRAPSYKNPYRAGSSAFHGWNDGHYDEQSARVRAIESHSSLLWSQTSAT
jgi:hypothetical protein